MSISSKKSSAMERDSVLSLLVGNTKPDMKNLVKLRRRLKLRELALAHTRLWSERTTIEGVPHLMAAHSVQRKFCWAIIMLTVTILGLVHLVRSVQDFLASGVASQVTVDAAPAEFPSVTLCSLKPASESLLSYYRPVMDRHLERHWGYFDAWFTHQRRQGKTESYRDYRLRIVKVLAKMLEVLWVSDDTRDLSLLDYSTILECQFNGQPCNKKNFSLVQHYRHWNCYMFRPHPSLRYDNPTGEHNAGLMLNIFADSNFFSSTSSSHSEYNRSRRDSNRDYRIEGLSLRQFLADEQSEFRLNRLLDVNHLSSDGMQVILHPTGSYPMFYKTRFTVKNSESAILHVFSMERNRINQADSPCSSQLLGTIDYVTNFGIGPDNQKRREFTESVEDVLNDRIQDLIYQRCGCYSHRMPFRVGKSLLCYYAPLQYRKQPSSELLTQIYCHDYWHQKFIGISELDDVSTVVRPCHETYREVRYKSTRWPTDEDLVSVTILYFLHRLANGTELSGPNDPHDHRIFNFSDAEVLAAATKNGTIKLSSRENVAIRSLLLPRCAGIHEFHEGNIAETAACLNKDIVRRNLLRINVRLASPAATVYNESYSYTGIEFLSEIGGVLGLWFGVSLLTIFEFFELIYVIMRSKQRIDKNF